MNENPHLSEDIAETETLNIRHGFKVGQWHLLIPIGISAELLEEANLSPIPLSPPWFLGMASHRGDVIPVFSMPSLFTPQDSANTSVKNQNWLLILDKPPKMSGLQIDSYPQLLNTLEPIQWNDQVELPELLRPFINGIYQANGQNWLDFQYDAWLLSLKSLFQGHLASR